MEWIKKELQVIEVKKDKYSIKCVWILDLRFIKIPFKKRWWDHYALEHNFKNVFRLHGFNSHGNKEIVIEHANRLFGKLSSPDNSKIVHKVNKVKCKKDQDIMRLTSKMIAFHNDGDEEAEYLCLQELVKLQAE